MKKNVLFLCTGNSCRSQMGEAIVNEFFSDEWQGYSAGTRPTGYVHHIALHALKEIGASTKGLVSKHSDTLRDVKFDKVFTVCDNAAEDCPVWFGEGTVEHTPFPDPADAEGDIAERLAVFRQVRDDLRAMLGEKLA